MAVKKVVRFLPLLFLFLFFIFFQFNWYQDQSMQPTVSKNSLSLVLRSFVINNYSDGDVIIFEKKGVVYMARVIASLGSPYFFKFEKMKTKGFPSPIFTIPNLKNGELFVLVDNRDFGIDSRHFGPIKKDEVLGLVLFRGRGE